MSTTKGLSDVLKSAPSVSDATGLSILAKNGNGEFKAIPSSQFGLTNLTDCEPPGTTLTLREFTDKYITGKRVGHKLTDMAYSDAITWYVSIGSSLKLRTQFYIIEVVKHRLNLDQPWASITLLFMPAHTLANAIYIVNQMTGETKEEYSCTVKKINLSSL